MIDSMQGFPGLRLRDWREPRDWRRPWFDPPGWWPCCCVQHPDCTQCGSLLCEYLLTVSGLASSNPNDTCCGVGNGSFVMQEVVSAISTNPCGSDEVNLSMAGIPTGNCWWVSPWCAPPSYCGEGWPTAGNSHVGNSHVCVDETIAGTNWEYTPFNMFYLLRHDSIFPGSPANSWNIELWQSKCEQVGSGNNPPPFPCNTCLICDDGCPAPMNSWNGARRLITTTVGLAYFRARWRRQGQDGCDIIGDYDVVTATPGNPACSTIPATVTLSVP